MAVKVMADKYYPRLWSKARIEMLVKAGRLTREEADEVYAEKETTAPVR